MHAAGWWAMDSPLFVAVSVQTSKMRSPAGLALFDGDCGLYIAVNYSYRIAYLSLPSLQVSSDGVVITTDN